MGWFNARRSHASHRLQCEFRSRTNRTLDRFNIIERVGRSRFRFSFTCCDSYFCHPYDFSNVSRGDMG